MIDRTASLATLLREAATGQAPAESAYHRGLFAQAADALDASRHYSSEQMDAVAHALHHAGCGSSAACSGGTYPCVAKSFDTAWRRHAGAAFRALGMEPRD